MPSTKQNKIPLKREEYVKAWSEIAPEESFAGMTLAEFELATEPAIIARDRLSVLRIQAVAALQQRNLADEQLRETLIRVINAVRAAHGENSALYRAFGYVTTSERASGLTRKAAAATAPPPRPPADANAA